MYAYCRSVYTRHLRDPYGVDRHWWPGKRAPSAQNGLRITVYGVDLHSKYKPGFRDQESYHTILDISFDTCISPKYRLTDHWFIRYSIYRSIAIPPSIDIERSQVSRYFDISSIEPALFPPHEWSSRGNFIICQYNYWGRGNKKSSYNRPHFTSLPPTHSLQNIQSKTYIILW